MEMQQVTVTITLEIQAEAPAGMSESDLLEACENAATWGTLADGEGVALCSTSHGPYFRGTDDPTITIELGD